VHNLKTVHVNNVAVKIRTMTPPNNGCMSHQRNNPCEYFYGDISIPGGQSGRTSPLPWGCIHCPSITNNSIFICQMSGAASSSTTAHDTSDDDDNSSDDDCCHFDAEAGQTKTVLESILIGEKAPVEEVVTCVHNLLAIACEDPEMRKQVLMQLMPESTVEGSNHAAAPPIVVDISDNTPMANYNPHAFATSKRSGKRLNPNAARQAKFKAADKIQKAIEAVGDQDQRLVAIHAALKKPANAAILKALGLVEAFEFKSKVAIDCLNAVDEIVNNPVCLLQTTDNSLAFQNTVFMAITRTPPPVNATAQVKLDYKESLSNLAKYLELHKKKKK
jgi:hypothetical protein